MRVSWALPKGGGDDRLEEGSHATIDLKLIPRERLDAREASVTGIWCASDSRANHRAISGRRYTTLSVVTRLTRRNLLWSVAAAAAPVALTVPLRRVIDGRAQCTGAQWDTWWHRIWPEAVRMFARGGIRFQVADARGEIKRTASSRPLFTGLERGWINLMITDRVPLDYGGVSGVTTRGEGYDLCVIALSEAHANQAPYFSVNTCVHELLHLLLQDALLRKPKWYQTGEREMRIDWYATQLWLFGDASEIRRSAEVYLRGLRQGRSG
ncbi:MAG: hypothetical protein ABI759_30445 [Candidatus Solibacter sp.]